MAIWRKLRVTLVAAAAIGLTACAGGSMKAQEGRRPLTDLEMIDRIHSSGPNWKWEPDYKRDQHEGQRTHLLVVSRKDLTRICGNVQILACTVPIISKEIAASVNRNIIRYGQSSDALVEEGGCAIFITKRDPAQPRFWFYLLGHEFAHCRYGQFHPADVPVGDDI